MNIKLITQILGKLFMLEAVLMLPALLVSVIYRGTDIKAFIMTIGILLVVGGLMSLVKPEKKKMFARDGMMIVSLAWICLSVFGALPFVFSGAIPSFIDAFFECVSGFTTTGSSILTEVESLPKGVIFWRSFTHWFGGMGILVFSLLLLPSMSGQTQHLMRAESAGPVINKLVPKIKETSRILYSIYIVLTVVCAIALLLTGMPLYDALINALGTAGTGGFSNWNNSIAHYDNVAVDIILSVGMLVFSVSFSVYFMLLKKKFKDVLQSEELRFFIIMVTGATVIIAFNIWDMYGSLGQAFRHAFFQVSTIVSTTGYATTDFNQWPMLSKAILLMLMFFGGCAGSTAGGLKQIRALILLKAGRRATKQAVHPRSILPLRIDGKSVDNSHVMDIAVFTFVYIAIMGIAIFLISFDNFDFETTFTAVLATMSNIGPGFGMVGPTGNFSQFSDFSKLVLSFCMLAGRLEIYPLLVLFQRDTWKRN